MTSVKETASASELLVEQEELVALYHDYLAADGLQTQAGSSYLLHLETAKATGNMPAIQAIRSDAKDALVAKSSFIAEFDESTVTNALHKTKQKHRAKMGHNVAKTIAGMDGEAFDVLLDMHDRKVKRAQTQLEALLPSFYNRMEAEIETAIEQGHLPAVVRQRFNDRKKQTQWITTDDHRVSEERRTMAYSVTGTNIVGMDYNCLFNLSTEEKRENLHHVMTHEFVHQMTGLSGTRASTSTGPGIHKSGLQRGLTNKNYDAAGHNLNEAITEYIAVGLTSGDWQHLDDTNESSRPSHLTAYYNTLRHQLRALSKHIPTELLINHYFASTPAETAVTTRQLHAAFRENLGVSYDAYLRFLDRQESGIVVEEIVSDYPERIASFGGRTRYLLTKERPSIVVPETQSRADTRRAKHAIKQLSRIGSQYGDVNFLAASGARYIVIGAKDRAGLFIHMALPADFDASTNERHRAALTFYLPRRRTAVRVGRSNDMVDGPFYTNTTPGYGFTHTLHGIYEQLPAEMNGLRLTPETIVADFITDVVNFIDNDFKRQQPYFAKAR